MTRTLNRAYANSLWWYTIFYVVEHMQIEWTLNFVFLSYLDTYWSSEHFVKWTFHNEAIKIRSISLGEAKNKSLIEKKAQDGSISVQKVYIMS